MLEMASQSVKVNRQNNLIIDQFLIAGIIARFSITFLKSRRNMYAVIKTGGKQYRVIVGETLKVEKLELAEGESLELDSVLMIADGEEVKVGAPYLEGGKVTATIKSHGRGKKVDIIKFRRRKHHRKQMGHRQSYTELEITAING